MAFKTVYPRNRLRLMAGGALIAIGGVLLAAAVTYAAYGHLSQSNLDSLVVGSPDRGFSLEDLQKDLLPGAPAAGNETPPSGTGETPSSGGNTPEPSGQGALIAARPGTTADFSRLRTERSDCSRGFSGSALGAQFTAVDWSKLPFSTGSLPAPTRVQIPAIGLDSRVIALNVEWRDDYLVWQTAPHAVGHHIGTPHPGELGKVVFSGHISSPASREGEVFKRLPEIPIRICEGQTVDIIVEAGTMRYLYRAISSDVVTPDKVGVVFEHSKEPRLTLVTCVPDYIYSHRLMVDAVLVGVAPKA